MDQPLIRPVAQADWPAVHAIHAAGIATGGATFEVAPPAKNPTMRCRSYLSAGAG